MEFPWGTTDVADLPSGTAIDTLTDLARVGGGPGARQRYLSENQQIKLTWIAATDPPSQDGSDPQVCQESVKRGRAGAELPTAIPG
ncbi:hypothetical protein BH09ACT12_BH09ACT12_07550 [soil metagenome]